MITVGTLRSVAVVLVAPLAAGAGFALGTGSGAHGTGSVEGLTRAAERGNAQAQYTLGFMYATGFAGFEEDSGEALAWYRLAAEQGFARAQSVLGSTYARGVLVEQDFTQAIAWCRLGAEQGDAGGQLCMASLYAGGCGVGRDDAESARWYRLAADQGSGEAQARLGDMYAAGEGGVEQDPAEADKWYRRAVEPGTYRAKKAAGVETFPGRHLLIHLFALARMYQDGAGVPRNDVAAYKWLDIQDRLPSHWPGMTSEGERPELDDLAHRMTSEQVANAQRAADAFIDTYRIDSYEAWRNLAFTRSMPKEFGHRPVLRALYPVIRLGYPVARWWWRTAAAIGAKLSPPVIPAALTTTASSGPPLCSPGAVTSTDH